MEPVEGAAVVPATAGTPKEMVMMVILIWNKVLESQEQRVVVLGGEVGLRNIGVSGQLYWGFESEFVDGYKPIIWEPRIEELET